MDTLAQLFSNFYFAAAIQGFILAVFLFRRCSDNRLSNCILGFLTAVFSLHIASYGLAYGRFLLEWPHLWGVASPLPLLFGPLIYLYLRSLLEGSRFKLKAADALHALPTLMLYLWMSDLFLMSGEEKVRYIEALFFSGTTYVLSAQGKLVAALTFLQLGVYLLLAFRVAHNNESLPLPWAWPKRIAAAFGVYVLFFTAYKISLFMEMGVHNLICHSTKSGMALSMYAVAWADFSTKGLSWLDGPVAATKNRNGNRKGNGGPSREVLEMLAEQLKHLMSNDRLYLDDSLSLGLLAAKLDQTPQTVSRAINNIIGMRYSEWINRYRIEHAKSLLAEQPNLKILAVAMESGFKSKVTFNVVFKKLERMTPSEYRKQVQRSVKQV